MGIADQTVERWFDPFGWTAPPATSGKAWTTRRGRFAGHDVGSLADLPRDHGSGKSGMTGRAFASRHTAMGLIAGAAAAIAVVSGVIAVLQQFVDPRGLSVLYPFAISTPVRVADHRADDHLVAVLIEPCRIAPEDHRELFLPQADAPERPDVLVVERGRAH